MASRKIYNPHKVLVMLQKKITLKANDRSLRQVNLMFLTKVATLRRMPIVNLIATKYETSGVYISDGPAWLPRNNAADKNNWNPSMKVRQLCEKPSVILTLGMGLRLNFGRPFLKFVARKIIVKRGSTIFTVFDAPTPTGLVNIGVLCHTIEM